MARRRKRTTRTTRLDINDNMHHALHKLIVAAGALEEQQGRIARRNARRSFGALLGGVRRAMNKQFPLLPKVPRVARPAAPPPERKRRIRLS